MILDTVYLVKLFGGKQNAHEKATELESRNVVQRVPSPVFTEIEYGATFQADRDERRRIRNVSRMYSVTRLTEEIATRAGQLHAQADKAAGGVDKSGADAVDAMVAAVADIADEKVVTENVDDFRRLGVEVEPF